MDKLKEPTTMRLSTRTKSLLKALAKNHDTTLTAIMEEAVREKALRENVFAVNEARAVALAGEATLSKLWDNAEEDAAWRDL